MSRINIAVVLIFIAIVFAPLLWHGSTQRPELGRQCEIEVDVDARDLTRGLIHSRIRIPMSAVVADEVNSNAQTLQCRIWFPKWVPGIHAPRGAIQNMAGLFCVDHKGKAILWERDQHDVHSFLLQVPVSVPFIDVHLDYICNQPSVNSRGVDSFGDALHGIMSWNNVLVYPDGYTEHEIYVRPRILLPDDWTAACALPVQKTSPDEDGYTAYERCDIRTCVDSPLIAGKFQRTYVLNDGGKDVRLHCVGENEKSITASDKFLQSMRRMVVESRLLFGKEHYQSYDFLLVCSDSFPRMGLEHLASSLNGVSGSDLATGSRGAMRVMSHEYIHSWCGKHRRPHDMHTHDFHTPKGTTLLWVYEGLTQYLGNVIAARSGMKDENGFRDLLKSYITSLRTKNGRRWRSLADTATASYLLRGGSYNWPNWLRGQDYYIEGALIWLEVDCMLRQHSEGKISIDDFARIFLGNEQTTELIDSFTYEDVLTHLHDLMPYDWRRFFAQRVYEQQKEFDMSFMEKAGWRVDIVDTPNTQTDDLLYSYRNAYESIGMGMSARGRIYRVLKDSPAYVAGLARGMQLIKINDVYSSPEVLHHALEAAKESGTIVMEIEDELGRRKCTVQYSGGARYLSLGRVDSTPDLLHEIIQPLHRDANAESVLEPLESHEPVVESIDGQGAP